MDARILIVSFHFAPQTAVGAKRFTFLSDLFYDRFGSVHVLTVDPRFTSIHDASFSSRATVHRTGMLVPAPSGPPRGLLGRTKRRLWTDYLCLLDRQSGWIVPAVLAGRRLVREHEIDLIIATGPPFSAHVVGYLLKRSSGVPLILDYRDPWNGCGRPVPRLWGSAVNRRLEALTNRAAARLVVTTPAMREDVRARFGADLAARTSVINNGYHPRRVTERPAEGSFEIAYAGALYGGRRLELIATAVRRLLDEGIIRRGAFKFHIFGDTRPENQVTLAELGVQDLFEEHGFVPFEKLMRRLEGMNALALMIADNMAYSISYKFYDYLSLRRPVLAIAPAASQIEKTVERYDCGVFADIHEPFSIYRAIRELATDRRKFNFESVEEFTWENLSQRYVNLIEETLRESNASRGS